MSVAREKRTAVVYEARRGAVRNRNPQNGVRHLIGHVYTVYTSFLEHEIGPAAVHRVKSSTWLACPSLEIGLSWSRLVADRAVRFFYSSETKVGGRSQKDSFLESVICAWQAERSFHHNWEPIPRQTAYLSFIAKETILWTP